MADSNKEYEKAYQYYLWLVDTRWEEIRKYPGGKSFRLLEDVSKKVVEDIGEYLKDNNLSPEKFSEYATKKQEEGE